MVRIQQESPLSHRTALPWAKMGKLESRFATDVSGIVLVHLEPGVRAGETGALSHVSPAPPTAGR